MTHAASSFRFITATPVFLACAVALTACGGGGGGGAGGTGGGGTAAPGGTSDAPTVGTAALVATAKYGQKLVVTATGTGLDRVTGSTTGCKDFGISTTAPFVSTATTAYFQCTVTAVGPAQVVLKRPSDGATLSTISFNVPMPQVRLTFSNGAGINNIVEVTLAPDKTPVTVDNFLSYVNSGFYKDTPIHRVVPGFVIQGGGYAGPFTAIPNGFTVPGIKPNSGTIVLEVNKGLSNTQWTIAMARLDAANTATSQFYFNLVDNSAKLDPSAATALSPANIGYAVFGAITLGTAAVAAIANPAIAPCASIPTFSSGNDCTPVPSVMLTKAEQIL